MAKAINLPEVLDRFAHGGKVSPKDAQAAVAAAAGLRHEFLRDAFQTLETITSRSPDFEAFARTMQSMGETYMRHGIVSGKEMQHIWFLIERLR